MARGVCSEDRSSEDAQERRSAATEHKTAHSLNSSLHRSGTADTLSLQCTDNKAHSDRNKTDWIDEQLAQLALTADGENWQLQHRQNWVGVRGHCFQLSIPAQATATGNVSPSLSKYEPDMASKPMLD